MHPLSYQPLATSCWVTSMLNAIIYLNRGKHVPYMANNLLNTILIEDGVFYYSKKQKKEFEAIINAVGSCVDLDIRYVTGEDVETCLNALNFKTQVAVCDIGSGGHSILINGKSDRVFQAFDPYWDNIKKAEHVEGKYHTCPPYFVNSSYSVNLKICKDHFFGKRNNDGFPMGAVSKRVATVLTKASRETR